MATFFLFSPAKNDDSFLKMNKNTAWLVWVSRIQNNVDVTDKMVRVTINQLKSRLWLGLETP